ncbi:MAG: LlaJI family restriction endonuclease [Clostridium sp.]|nr:LlaJI family restriction endonuclease [Clostridium sp.]MCM1534665.1 LlaJI family restriction endonuclease [Clostridium sp.]
MEKESDLRKRCHINTNEEGDRFVGVKADTEDAVVYFPVGYQLPDDEIDLKRDVLHLFQVLAEFTDVSDKVLAMKKFEAPQSVDFPINAYLEIINNYMENGYYMENDPVFKTSDRGNIDWVRTIQRQPALIQANLTPIYTQYTVRQSAPNENKEITRIHTHCVYESFDKLGWLFTPYMPPKPVGAMDAKRFIAILNDKLGDTNLDKDKRLFRAMLDLLKYIDEKTSERQFYFGTDYFEGVWERLIDRVFGIKNKQDYFPRTRWLLSYGKYKEKYPLEPDSIMIYDGKIYVLDAKYYRYGITGNPNHLPDSSSINKQITYAEYIYSQRQMPDGSLFNAFLMPYNAAKNFFGIQSVFGNIGVAVGDWKSNTHNYEKIQGILVDTRYLMYHYTGNPKNSIIALAQSIESALAANNGLLPQMGNTV